MSQRKLQSGFSVFEFVIICGVVLALGLVGYAVYNRQSSNDSGGSASIQTVADVPSAPAISSTADLDKASTMLDQIDLDSSNTSDTSQLDSQLSAF